MRLLRLCPHPGLDEEGVGWLPVLPVREEGEGGKGLPGKIADLTGPARRLLVERVEVDEPKNEARVFLTDLRAAPSKAVE